MATEQLDHHRQKAQTAAQDSLRWRPTFHMIAPHGWLNDPCGLGYDPLTGKYHLSFQWNPNDNDWGDTAWGHSTSYDFISWKTAPEPCLSPETHYDNKGIFTGCLWPTNVDGKQDGTLTYLYTSVSRLPIHYTLDYVSGCESLSLAVSHNGGVSWERLPVNPVLPGPPENLKVTGWRDPFISTWPTGPHNTNKNSNGSAEPLYGFISGGIAGQTPTAFVYAINPNNLAEWNYAGHLMDVGLNFRPSRWSGDLGVNWEVVNFATLGDGQGTSKNFIVMGSEGCISQDESATPFKNHKDVASGNRVQRGQVWMCIKNADSSKKSDPASTSDSQALMEYEFGGIFDHGCLYASNSFWDPVISQQIVFGWIIEDDLPNRLRHPQSWSGAISLPRVLSLTTLPKVKRGRVSDLASITSVEATPDGQGTYTVRTLGITPDRRLEGLRMKAHRSQLPSQTELGSLKKEISEKSQGFLPLKTLKWELNTEIAVGKNCSRVGFAIGHNQDFSHQTVLYWDPLTETFVIKRPASESDHSPNGSVSTIKGEEETPTSINHAPEVAPHTLFTFAAQKSITNGENSTNGALKEEQEKAGKEEEVEEPLRIRVFYDVSVLEVFVNDRTVITTRIYSSECNNVGSGRNHGIQFFAETTDGAAAGEVPAVVQRAFVWDGVEAPGGGEPKL